MRGIGSMPRAPFPGCNPGTIVLAQVCAEETSAVERIVALRTRSKNGEDSSQVGDATNTRPKNGPF
jgi:hypothetical protein